MRCLTRGNLLAFRMIYKFRLSLIAFLATVVLLPNWVQADECRDAWVRPVVSFSSQNSQTTLNREKSSDQITQLSRSVGALRNHGGATLLGLAYTKMRPNLRVKIDAREERKGVFCIVLTEVQMAFDTVDSEVFIDRRYRPGTCAYNAILEHEMEHMAINRRVLEKYKPLLKQRLERKSANIRPFRTTSMQAGAEIASNRMMDDMKSLIDEFFKVRQRENNRIDTERSYEAVKRKCNDW